VFSGALDDLKEAHRRLTLRFAEARSQPPALAGVLAWEGSGHEWTAVCHGRLDDVQSAAAGWGARVVEERVPSLNQIFLARVGTKCPAPVEG
jgi:ABC-2 type transport system ATP-binding protein